jgi:ketosteroid isomerase-like protein
MFSVKGSNGGDTEDDRKENEKSRSTPFNPIPGFEDVKMSEEELKKEVQKYKLQAQIDSILNDPDAPFDLGTELKKVTGGISPPLPAETPEFDAEGKVHDLESSMYEAVENGNYDAAQKKKIMLNQMHIDDVGSVLQVNAAFYKAFSQKDYDAMEKVWLSDASALCIHPSNQPIFGAKNVLASWKEMFAGGNEAFQKNKIEPENIRLSVKGTTAILTCDEDVYTKRFVRGRKRLANEKKGKPGMELVNKLVTTNIFRKVNGKWYMIHHHASWHSESDAAKRVMNAQRENGSNTVEGNLGIPGHVGLGGEKKGADGTGPGEKKVVKRVFTGSLSDLLAGGLDDILKGSGSASDSDDEDDLGGIQSFVVRGNNLEPINDSSERGEDEEENDEDHDEDESDDDGEDSQIIDVDASAPSGGPSVNKKIITLGPIAINGKPTPQVTPPTGTNDTDKCTIRQNCISALRKLASEGMISQEQKTILLTDIITKSSTGEFSLVEVAYDLLCTEGEDETLGEQDFADQCRVFAANLEKHSI